MKMYLSNQKSRLKQHLDFLKSQRVMDYDKTLLTEKTSTVQLNPLVKLSELDLRFIFNYQIFPKYIMSFLTQWQNEDRSMAVGDTIVQQVFLPPVPAFSQKIIFGVRISEIINEENRKGFSYETLQGHVEKGVSTFTVEESGKEMVFKIHTYSTPGNLLARVLGPVFSLPYQAFCTRAALKNVKRKIEQQ